MAMRLQRWSYLAGLIAVVLFVVGAILMFDGPNGSSPAKMTAWYQSSSHRTQIHVGWILFGLGLFFFVWFVAALREQVSVYERADGRPGGFLSASSRSAGARSPPPASRWQESPPASRR